MRRITCIVISMLIASVVLAQEYSFRQVKWGMSPDEVKMAEKAKWMGEGMSSGAFQLYYRVNIAEYPFFLIYEFVDNRLVCAMYILDVMQRRHFNKNMYINDYDDLKEMLIAKYDKPVQEGTVWLNDFLRDEPENYGLAISIGHMVMFSSWLSSETNTEIRLMLRGDNFRIGLAIAYFAGTYEDYRHLWDRVRTEALQDVL